MFFLPCAWAVAIEQLLLISFMPFCSESVTIPQSTVPDTSLFTITATDADQVNTSNSQITFSLEDPTLPFAIDANSGLLSTRLGSPDLAAQLYTITVLAADGGTPALTGTATVMVDVAAPNFQAPVFPDGLVFDITENAKPVPDMELYSFDITDGDVAGEGRVDAAFVQTEYSPFFRLETSISDSMTTVRILYSNETAQFDREQLENFTLTVIATDLGNELFRMSTEADILVTILDANDNPPVFIGDPYTAQVAEDAEVGTSIAQVSTMDADIGNNAVAMYSFLNYAGSDFAIDGVSGNITVNGPLTVTGQSLVLTVGAFDGVFSVNTTISIIVLEVNDNAPQFASFVPPTISLPEETETETVLLNVSVSDADTGVSGEVVLSLEQDGDLFGYAAYESNEFYIFLNQPLDFEVSELL